MRKSATILATAALFAFGSYVPPANAEVNLNINVGPPDRFWSRAGARLILPLSHSPGSCTLPTSGFYVSVGAPYDVIYYGDRYYIYNEGSWYRSRNYRGPWDRVKSRRVPTKITRHQHEEIRRFRDTEYRRAETYDRRSRNIRPDRDRNDRRDKNDRNDKRDRDDNRPRWR